MASLSSKYYSIREKKTKVKLQVWISEDVYNMLIELAPSIAGKYRGAVSEVVEEAIRNYLLPRLHTQIHTNPKLSVRKVYHMIKEYIKEITHNPIVFEVPEKILDLAISETRGSDPRTITKWKNLFIKQGLIKPVGGKPPNRIFEMIG